MVTLVSPEGAYGGPVRVAVNQAKELLRLGHEVVIYGTFSGYSERPTSIEGVPAKLFKARNVFPRAGFAGTMSATLWKALAADLQNFDVVHVHMARDLVTLPAALVAKLLGTPYVLQTHGMVDPSGKFLSRPLDSVLTRPLLRHAFRVFFLTPVEQHQLAEVARRPLRLQELHNGVPKASVESSQADTPEVLYLARLHPRKQPTLFAKVAAALLASGQDARFTLVGPDEGEGAKVAEVIAKASSKRLQWEGALAPEMTLPRMKKAAVYVLPSFDEPFPMSVLEAMSVGVPVIITRTCGLADVIREGKAGVIIDSNFQSLEKAIVSLLEDEIMRNEMGENARRLAEESFSMDVIARRLEDIYEQSVRAC